MLEFGSKISSLNTAFSGVMPGRGWVGGTLSIFSGAPAAVSDPGQAYNFMGFIQGVSHQLTRVITSLLVNYWLL